MTYLTHLFITYLYGNTRSLPGFDDAGVVGGAGMASVLRTREHSSVSAFPVAVSPPRALGPELEAFLVIQLPTVG